MGGLESGADGFERYSGAASQSLPVPYVRRQPEKTVLHQVVREHLPAFLDLTTQEGHGVPAYARREMERYLDCGILALGFSRVCCDGCGFERLVGFSCKGRGICPSCGARRMAATAAELVDAVIPRVPVRQWVLTTPHRVRYLLARRPEVVTAVLACFLRLVTAHLRRSARRLGVTGGQAGSVTWVQRFGDAINVHPHFHAIVPDGVFVEADDGTVAFHEVPPPTDAVVERLCATVARRVTRLLKRRGFLDGEDEPTDAMSALQRHSVQSTLAFRRPRGEEAPASKRRCASIEGFSVHANIGIHASDRQGLEHLLRYGARNSISLDRLERHPDGGIVYRFKHPMADGSLQVVLGPMEFLGRLIALVPPPRAHLIRFHGVFGPNARLRSKVVLLPKPKQRAERGAKPAAPCPPRRLDWAGLLKRVFAVDVLQCPRCDGRMRVLAYLTEYAVVKKILAHLGLPTEAPPRGRPRARQAIIELGPPRAADLDAAIKLEQRLARMSSSPALPAPEALAPAMHFWEERPPNWEQLTDPGPTFSEADFIDIDVSSWDQSELGTDGADETESACDPGAKPLRFVPLKTRSRLGAGGEARADPKGSDDEPATAGGGDQAIVELEGLVKRAGASGLGIEIVGSGDEVEIAPGEEQRGDERRGGEGGGGQGGRAEVSARWRWAPRQGQAPPVGEGAQPSAEVGDPLPDGERGRGEGSDR